MSADYPSILTTALRRGLGPNWTYKEDGAQLRIVHRDSGSPYCPPRRTPSWCELLDRLEDAFAACGVHRAPPLPLRWGRDTDFTISAVQALDPYLKDRRPYALREGYLPQPVVRFTGKRRADGTLDDGFATAFVNVSRVQRIASVDEHVHILDDWISVLSRLGFHARHLTMTGQTMAWRRGPVGGITIHISHAGVAIGDIVLLWNVADPTSLVTDLGSGLERLGWAQTRRDWRRLVYGSGIGVSLEASDAIRTATLIVGSGIYPASRGPGSALRRLLRAVPPEVAALGTSHAVRAAHWYWSLTASPLLAWSEITAQIEDELVVGTCPTPWR